MQSKRWEETEFQCTANGLSRARKPAADHLCAASNRHRGKRKGAAFPLGDMFARMPREYDVEAAGLTSLGEKKVATLSAFYSTKDRQHIRCDIWTGKTRLTP